MAFCRRHAVVAEVTAVGRGTIRETKVRPRLEDRGLSLAMMIGSDLDLKIQSLLASRHATHAIHPFESAPLHRDLVGPPIIVSADQAPRAVWRDRLPMAADGTLLVMGTRLLRWEWNWSALVSTGFLSRVVLSVSDSEVTLWTNREIVFKGVPGWIQRSGRSGPVTVLDRAVFTNRLAAAVEASLTSV